MAIITGDDDASRKFGEFPEKFRRQIVKIFNAASVEMQRYLREERLTGGTSESKLAVRSGRLRGSVLVKPAKEEGESVKGGITIGTVYGRVHIGPKGQKTTIRPKGHPYLAIPLEAAKTAAGVARGAPRSGLWVDTFVLKSKKGNLIIMGRKYTVSRRGRTTGYGLRRTWRIGDLEPLFLLRKEVTIPARVDPLDVIRHIAPKIMDRLREEGLRGRIE